MADTKNNYSFFSELGDDRYVYEFDKSIPIKNQILASYNNSHLINVRKEYTNNIYFGVCFSTYHHGETPFVSHSILCKDRGYTEEAVATLEGFFSVRPKEQILHQGSKNIQNRADGFTFEKQDILYPPILNRSFDVYYGYENNKFRSTVIKFHDGEGVVRGLYGCPEEKYQYTLDTFGDAVLEDTVPTKEQLDNFYNKTVISLSNQITRVNTEYSYIKVYHKTEI